MIAKTMEAETILEQAERAIIALGLAMDNPTDTAQERALLKATLALAKIREWRRGA